MSVGWLVGWSVGFDTNFKKVKNEYLAKLLQLKNIPACSSLFVMEDIL